MKRFLSAALFVVAASPVLAADVGVSVSIGQPGFYGTIDIGSFPRPQVVYAEPVVIHAVPSGRVMQPVYMHVPPGHAKKWSKYCGSYNACGRPVYFVQDNWYNNTYVPKYREKHGRDKHGYEGRDKDGHGESYNGKGHKGKGNGKGHD